MKVLAEDKDNTVVQLSNLEKQLIDCLFSMVSSMDVPNWGTTDVGYGGPRLNEERFDALSAEWRTVMKHRAGPSSDGAGGFQAKVAV